MPWAFVLTWFLFLYFALKIRKVHITRHPSKVQDLWLSAQGIRFAEAFLSKSCFWAPEKLRDYQQQRLLALLRGAYENTDYYRELLWKHDVDPYAARFSMEDFSRIPILTKVAARDALPKLMNPSATRGALEFRTSGTTGDVFWGFVSKRHWVVEQGVVWRHWRWLGYHFRDRMAIVRSYVPRPGEPLWRHDRLSNFLYFSAYHLTPENAAKYLRKLQQWRPKVLRGYPASLFILARMSQELGIEMPPLLGILTASETLLPHYREVIEKAFGARVFDWYGQAECTIVLTECERHSGLHINSEYGFCELIAEPGLPDNERRIVATSLHNTAMPLIRYDTGDIATVKGTRVGCPCGRTLPLVESIRGRSDAMLRTPDGRVIPSVNFYTMMYEIDGILAFQLIQESIEQIEVRIETRANPHSLHDRLMAQLRSRCGDSLRIRIIENEGFVQTPDGKKQAIISRLTNAV